MNLYLTSVVCRKGTTNAPGIIFYTEWTKPMGFVPDALVQFIPEDGGAKFRLCNENIASYSRLMQETTALGGVLIHAKMFDHRYYPCLTVSGEVVRRTGLVIGDNLIARFEPGLVHLRKIPPGQVKVVIAGRMSGKWLLELGFAPEEVLTIAAETGCIICQLQPNGIERTAELVKYARTNAMSLVQVRRVADSRVVIPLIEIQPSRFTKAGFATNDTLLATYEHGRISLEKLDFKALGFD